jgi:hypothetical protein
VPGEKLQIRGIQPPGLFLQQADFDLDSSGPQLRQPTAMDLRKRIALGRHHPANAGLDDCAGAGGRFPLVAAGLERDVHCGPGGPAAGQSQGFHLGMGLAETAVPPFADDFRPLDDNTTDHRVGLDVALPLSGQLQGTLHVPDIKFGLFHQKSPMGSCQLSVARSWLVLSR